eukprot:NODE_2688_length_1119_cov_18.969758_g2565_i0.p2 GENE.NODE_2688_length_1119_cov_18.969758_g2565_i0~~NODE_2688_length_1119_cov_18.969758_g2565_i0.p2  ORF type:complete len:179 (-),score=60.60 NODE_2688_length_1119_cov_18.969758_g2565_i0:95-631(-)
MVAGMQSQVVTMANHMNEGFHYTSQGGDALDVAVAEVLNLLHCPVSLDVYKLGEGEYHLDRKCVLRLVRGEVLVRRSHAGWERLDKYLAELYEPFLPAMPNIPDETQQLQSLLQTHHQLQQQLHMEQSNQRKGKPPLVECKELNLNLQLKHIDTNNPKALDQLKRQALRQQAATMKRR